jgi:ribosomal protein S18 acetylase RimI-like enzyme
MTLSATVRNYRDEDRTACRALWRELTDWHREIYQDSTIGGDQPEHYFDDHLAKVGPDHLWVAIYDSRVVGLVGLIEKGVEGEIEPLIVATAFRGRGIGTSLLEAAMKAAHTHGIRILEIHPVARNTKTIGWLYEHGFRTLGQIELFVDLTGRRWKRGPKLFGHQFGF